MISKTFFPWMGTNLLVDNNIIMLVQKCEWDKWCVRSLCSTAIAMLLRHLVAPLFTFLGAFLVATDSIGVAFIVGVVSSVAPKPLSTAAQRDKSQQNFPKWPPRGRVLLPSTLGCLGPVSRMKRSPCFRFARSKNRGWNGRRDKRCRGRDGYARERSRSRRRLPSLHGPTSWISIAMGIRRCNLVDCTSG